jgi:hypothetical protein
MRSRRRCGSSGGRDEKTGVAATGPGLTLGAASGLAFGAASGLALGAASGLALAVGSSGLGGAGSKRALHTPDG